ncbi:hypothetical protein CLOSTMETH_00812 [[Clostridium] methylpentosum DSM 5476]|uniref:Uncharacterized protein n=1 Tax=[Clostridium] methylpentosum DSM 5476 TaxID=537013 RepID=C0EAF7_9FIRM|nr:hypothetical protein CLOSTMETH_00812 [[Clostridium] methylpentosum DSM 5476]
MRKPKCFLNLFFRKICFCERNIRFPVLGMRFACGKTVFLR